jgi:hypothetical protein
VVNPQLPAECIAPLDARKAQTALVKAGYKADDDGLWRFSDSAAPPTARKSYED